MKLFLEIDVNILFQGRDGKLTTFNNKFLIIVLVLGKTFIWPYLLIIQQNPSLP